jgi:hypothetical protein
MARSLIDDTQLDNPPAGGGAPVGSSYIVQLADPTLTNEQALSLLSTGLLKNTTATGVLTIATPGIDYVAVSHTHAATDITSGLLAPDFGGTGLAGIATGDLLFGSGVNTWSKLAAGPNGRILTLAAGVPTWAVPPAAGAPPTATDITQTADAGLSGEQALGSLSSGLLKNTTVTGVLTIAVGGVDYAIASHTHTAGAIVAGVLPEIRGGTNQNTYNTGDMLYASGSNTLSALAAGSNGQILTLAGGAPTWANNAAGAPTGATYITQTFDGTLTNEQALSVLSTGILKNTTGTGVLVIASAGVDYAAASHMHDGTDITTGVVSVATGGTGISTYSVGDIIYASAATTFTKLAAGLNGQVLTLSGGVPGWSAGGGGAAVIEISKAGATIGTRPEINFIEGTNVTLTITDDVGNDRVNVTVNSTAGGAPTNATYITQTPNGTLTNEQALSALATGIVKNTSGTGVLSIASAGVDYAAAAHNHSAANITSGTLGIIRGGTGLTSFVTGEIIYASGASVLSKLSAGTTGQVLTMGASVPQWSTAAGGGNVTKVGTPTNNQVGVWTGDGTIEGDANFTWDAATLAIKGPLQQKGATSGTVTQAVPTTITSYTVTWPTAGPSAGEFLEFDGAGNMSFVPSPSGTLSGGSTDHVMIWASSSTATFDTKLDTDATSRCLLLGSNATLTSAPPSAPGTPGWKMTLYGGTQAIGADNESLLLRSNTWISLFDGANAAGNDTTTTPDTNAFINFSTIAGSNSRIVTKPTEYLEIESSTVLLQGNKLITASPQGADGTSGWKMTLYGATQAIGADAQSILLRSNTWVSLFDGANAAGDSSTAIPDSNAFLSFRDSGSAAVLRTPAASNLEVESLSILSYSSDRRN